jgi:SAM-dependent methyltransferase
MTSMLPKPTHLSTEYGAWFKDPQLVAAYPARPPYPAALIQLLAELVVDTPRVVLDAGCGTGELARRLAPLVDRVDAVDFSSAMVGQGQLTEGGHAANLRWIVAPVEEAPLAPPYALVTDGDSLHWMAWDIVLARFAAALTPHGVVAIVERAWGGPPEMSARVQPVVERYSPVRDYQPYNLVDELAQRGLFAPVGAQHYGPAPWWPTVDEYLESRHSQRGLSRTHMGPLAVHDFDAAIRGTLDELCRAGVIAQRAGRLGLGVTATVTWGRPGS